MWGSMEQMQMSSSGLEMRLPCHRGLCLNTTASLASDLGQGRLQAPTAQGDASSDLGSPRADCPVPVKKGGLFAGAELLHVCCPMGSLPAQLHLVWETKQPAHLSLQPFPRNYLHFLSPNLSKTLPQTLFVRQNHT